MTTLEMIGEMVRMFGFAFLVSAMIFPTTALMIAINIGIAMWLYFKTATEQVKTYIREPINHFRFE